MSNQDNSKKRKVHAEEVSLDESPTKKKRIHDEMTKEKFVSDITKHIMYNRKYLMNVTRVVQSFLLAKTLSECTSLSIFLKSRPKLNSVLQGTQHLSLTCTNQAASEQNGTVNGILYANCLTTENKKALVESLYEHYDDDESWQRDDIRKIMMSKHWSDMWSLSDFARKCFKVEIFKDMFGEFYSVKKDQAITHDIVTSMLHYQQNTMKNTMFQLIYVNDDNINNINALLACFDRVIAIRDINLTCFHSCHAQPVIEPNETLETILARKEEEIENKSIKIFQLPRFEVKENHEFEKLDILSNSSNPFFYSERGRTFTYYLIYENNDSNQAMFEKIQKSILFHKPQPPARAQPIQKAAKKVKLNTSASTSNANKTVEDIFNTNCNAIEHTYSADFKSICYSIVDFCFRSGVHDSSQFNVTFWFEFFAARDSMSDFINTILESLVHGIKMKKYNKDSGKDKSFILSANEFCKKYKLTLVLIENQLETTSSYSIFSISKVNPISLFEIHESSKNAIRHTENSQLPLGDQTVANQIKTITVFYHDSFVFE